MPKRTLEGVVVSDKGDKSIVVRVERTYLHPVLRKTVRRSKRYHAHDEANAYVEGETARITECAPKSKLKTWEVETKVGVEAKVRVQGKPKASAKKATGKTSKASNAAKARKAQGAAQAAAKTDEAGA
jgi:small subunit ribosomal protein S17